MNERDNDNRWSKRHYRESHPKTVPHDGNASPNSKMVSIEWFRSIWSKLRAQWERDQLRGPTRGATKWGQREQQRHKAAGLAPWLFAARHHGSSLGWHHYSRSNLRVEPCAWHATQFWGPQWHMPNLLLLPQWGHIARDQTTSCWLSSHSERVDQKKPILTSGASISLSKIKWNSKSTANTRNNALN